MFKSKSFTVWQSMTRWITLSLVVMLTITIPGPAALAQGPLPVGLGENALGDISPNNPQPGYAFTATAGQTVTIEVLAIADTLVPQFIVVDATNALIASGTNAALSNVVRDTVTFPQAGSYTIQVFDANNGQGQFVLRVSSAALAVPAIPLVVLQPVTGVLTSGTTAIYSLTADAARTLVLSVGQNGEGPPATAELLTSGGASVATISSALEGGTLNIPPGQTAYLLELRNDRPDAPAASFLLLLAPAEGGSAPGTPGVTAEPTVDPRPVLPSAGACVLATSNITRVNVRQVPSLDGRIIGALDPSGIYNVVGRNSDSSWYEVDYGGGRGWAAASVTRLGGDCRNVPITYTAPTATPTPFPTAVGTPPRTAGDNEYRDVEVPFVRGDLQGLSGAISYPNGDTQDTITYRWTGINPAQAPSGTQFRLSISCTGEGYENAIIEFLSDGSTRPCTPTPSNFQQLMYQDVPTAGGFTIKLLGGDNAYVEWDVQLSFYIPN